MKTGLFFGTFNPIHNGHLIIAQYFINHSDIDKICFIVTPHNPLKDQKDLIEAHHRLEMVRLAIAGNESFEVSDIEFHLPLPSYTFQTLMKLRHNHPDREFVVIMGTDSISSIRKWENYIYILDNFPLYIYPRQPNRFRKLKLSFLKIEFFNAPLISISSTLIRNELTSGKAINYLSPPQVVDYILKNQLF